MPRSPMLSTMLHGRPDDVEAAFYEALQTADLDKLMGCWADEDDIVCVHPGGPRLVGVGAIRAAFEAIFSNGSVRASPVGVRRVATVSSAVHSVIERVDVAGPQGPLQAWVVATNVYLKTPQGWRMVAHHASPGTAEAVQEASESPTLLH